MRYGLSTGTSDAALLLSVMSPMMPLPPSSHPFQPSKVSACCNAGLVGRTTYEADERQTSVWQLINSCVKIRTWSCSHSSRLAAAENRTTMRRVCTRLQYFVVSTATCGNSSSIASATACAARGHITWGSVRKTIPCCRVDPAFHASIRMLLPAAAAKTCEQGTSTRSSGRAGLHHRVLD